MVLLPPDDITARDDKAALRRLALARRDALTNVERAAVAAAIADRPLPIVVTRTTVVSGYCAIRSEIDALPLMRRFAEAGARLALPAVVARAQPLAMRAYERDDDLVAGRFGIREPRPDAETVEPDIVIVPLVTFDRRGHRIGYGAGFYDITLAALRRRRPIVAIGIAAAVQESPAVPATEEDAPLDLVLTDREVVDLR